MTQTPTPKPKGGKEPSSPHKSEGGFKAKATALAFALGMLPVLAVGTATYHFGSQSLKEQIVQARQIDDTGTLESKLGQQKKLLAILSIGTGAIALLSGAIAALWARRTTGSTMTTAVTATEQEDREARAERRRLLTETINRIRASLKEEDILKATVEEVRKVIASDRVVVYSREEGSRGLVVAESVSPGWPRALGRTIEDPCFEARYDEAYRNGRVRALDNIYEAGMTQCYIEQLEKLAVLANLVAPILNEGKLLGLLVAHQCSESRAWQQSEIDLFAQIAAQVGFALDNARLLAEHASLQKQANIESQWTQFFTDAIGHIRSSLKEEDVLETAVEEVRRILACDRVVVYSREEGSRGLVVAESIAPGWPRALGKTIEDPCFESRYDEKYRNGRVRALDDIHEAGLTQCYIEQLEKLSVKANLVAPILNESKLMGLLVAHQCSEPRAWQQFEIRWFAQIAAQVGFAIDNARVLANSASFQQQANTESQWTQLFTDAIGHIRSSLKEEDILKATVEEVRKVIASDRVVVYSREEGSRGLVVAESVSPGWPRALGKTIEDPCFESRYDEAYQNGRVRALDNIHKAGLTQCYIEQLEKLSVKANLVAPILNEGKLLGLLVVHQCSEPRAWQQFEIRWFAQIAAQVGFAIDNARVLANSASFQQQADTESQWTQFFTDAIRHIRSSLKEEDVLKAAVEEVRRVLDSDRVVIYSREEESRGLVVAESIAPGWPKALGRTIEDPCFEVRYDEKYRNGRVRALDNIYEAGMSPCYVEQLEKLSVKANLVAPILNENKLMGLLVTHQCSEPRAWQQFEIRWVAQMAAQVGFALDNARLMAKLEATGVQTQLIRNFIFLLWQSFKEEDILQTTVEEVRKAIKTDRVVVYGLDANWDGTVVAESVVPGWPRALWTKIKDPCFEKGWAEKYRQGRVQATNNIYEAGLTECHLKQLEPFAVQANLVAPILKDDQLFGLLIAHQCDRPRNWQQAEIDLFTQLAVQVGFALDCARRIEQIEREHIEQEHQTTDSTPVQQQLRQKEALWHQMSELLRDSETAFETFSRETRLQSEAITVALNQIQGAADSARGMTATAEQVELQVQQTTQAAQTGSETAKRSVDSLCAIQEAVADAAVKVKHLGQSSQKISEAVSLINDLAAQMNHQAINVTIGAGQAGDVTQESLVAIAEIVRSLTEQLVEATGKIEPLVGEIETKTNEVAAAMETGTKQAIAETQLLLEEQGQKLNQIATVSPQINALVEELAQAAAKGVQSASQSIEEVASLALQTSEQSTIVAGSFKKLKTVAQELEADADQFKER